MKKLGKLSKFVISAAIVGSVVTAASAAQALTLRQGTTGYNVRAIQTELRNRGYFPRSVSSTGYYGTITRTAVMRFQRANGLRVDGIAGPRTLAAMGYSGTGGRFVSTQAISNGTATGVVQVRTRLNVRSGPAISYTKLGSLPSGQAVNIVNQRNGWYQLESPEGEYWVNSRYVRVR
ncbi:putative peptidoglycan-binding domain-containing protein [Rivularia sp. PCC 7116]|uniref:peptidoglycan-binding protein n=1 Tax=Rivularia sp. PCC 7116 TaxID=373994 RepID=UPI00029EFEF5|nr:peptidoglycan-binding protein [Rivularia sp. PCC 7116]AFY53111.1 putative peptidoglycan-binding domain-containing protein [Rivularia sp. PCC 7116]